VVRLGFLHVGVKGRFGVAPCGNAVANYAFTLVTTMKGTADSANLIWEVFAFI